MSAELVLGIIGTVTGSAGLFISWLQWREDRNKLKIKATLSVNQSISIPQNHIAAKVSVSNHGRRPIKIRDMGILMGENKWETINGNRLFMKSSRIRPTQLNFNELFLGEGDRHDFEIDPLDPEFIRGALKDWGDGLTFYAIDSLDREYRSEAKFPREEVIKYLPETNSSDGTKLPNKRPNRVPGND